jgi:hypothetical protein
MYNQIQKFALNKDGYLICVTLLLKVYPRLNEKVVFVGLIQRCQSFTDMEPLK